MKTCYPFTLPKRTADWFLMKSFRITGTMAGFISSSSIPKTMSTTYIQNVMTKCIASCVGRHRPKEPMKICTDNECAVLIWFSDFDYVSSLHECGLLFLRKRDYIDVSCDGIECIELPISDIVNVPVELKKRCVKATIKKSIVTFEKYGDTVTCTYGSVPFNKCVSASDRLQLLHQIVAAGSLYGVYITYKV